MFCFHFIVTTRYEWENLLQCIITSSIKCKKRYIKSDRVENNNPDVPPRLYLIVEWFATDSEKRESWNTFINRHMVMSMIKL